jgi:hypothetical protein
MAGIKDTQNITEFRGELTDNLEQTGIVPITRNGNFSGVLISIGENDDATAKRLARLVKRNPEAGIMNLLGKALSE